MRWIPFSLCLWECGAILTGRYPTITALCERWPLLGDVLVDALDIHLHPVPRPRAS